METSLPFAEWLAEQLAKHGWSYQDLADRVSRQVPGRRCSRSVIGNYATGTNLPSPSHQEALADITATPLLELQGLVFESERLRERWRLERRQRERARWERYGRRAPTGIECFPRSRARRLTTRRSA